jgi:dihydrofolate synthase / folylpolyglutamate synthase
MQPHNMSLAVAAMDAAGATRTLGGLERGARDARVPGRMQRVRALDRNWLLDGAHNRESAAVLAESINKIGQVVMITGMVSGHEPKPLYEELAELVDHAIFAPIDFHRAVPPTDLAQLAGSIFPRHQSVSSVDAAIQEALSRTETEDLILVTGSFYLVGEVGRVLGLGQDAND